MSAENIFSVRVKKLRQSRNITQTQLGNIIGIKAQAINDIEHGRVKTTLDRAMTLADYFDVSLDYLVGRSDDPARR
jgi:transcriptional regulator with XRE-family HTH domain